MENMVDYNPFQKHNFISHNTYSLRVSCANCGFTGTVSIQRGKSIDSKKCPICDLKFLIKKLC